ncbi:hypothetical protein BDY21DRAFT_114771 [Lineolata rhizophorae]|uniref:Uncharacterized protein n=1 Tax=Lineolata rhizophorae TaxID=578093 RepID=A0A6A6NQC0_9PEZI|nr:hypothetical protein BDY21DRAFT_114771 [Lineolata rhizophorae]
MDSKPNQGRDEWMRGVGKNWGGGVLGKRVQLASRFRRERERESESLGSGQRAAGRAEPERKRQGARKMRRVRMCYNANALRRRLMRTQGNGEGVLTLMLKPDTCGGVCYGNAAATTPDGRELGFLDGPFARRFGGEEKRSEKGGTGVSGVELRRARALGSRRKLRRRDVRRRFSLYFGFFLGDGRREDARRR